LFSLCIGEYPELAAPCIPRNCDQYFEIIQFSELFSLCIGEYPELAAPCILRNCEQYFGIIQFSELFSLSIGEYPELAAPCILRNCEQYFGIIQFSELFSLSIGEYPELVAPCGLHQGHRCVERGVRFLCIQRSPRVCPRQLRIQVSAKEIRKNFYQKIRNMCFSKKYTSAGVTCSNNLPNYFKGSTMN
jgi:hypothetical protein